VSTITVQDAQAFAEKTKLDLGDALDGDLEILVSAQVMGMLSQRYTTTGWTSPELTPRLVRSIVAMQYTARFYMRTYSEDEGVSEYGNKLLNDSQALIAAIIAGAVNIPEIPIEDTTVGQPVFYPNDASSALEATLADPSLGPAKFTMGTIW
jgi:hypothetical protein